MSVLSALLATIFVAETQLYPVRELDRGYLGRYADLPLLFDYRTSRETCYESGRYSQADFEAYQRMAADYGLDALSYFPFARPSAGTAARRSPVALGLVPIVSFSDNPERCEREALNVRQAMESAASPRVNGKVVVLSYWDYGTPDAKALARHLAALRKRVGDGFVYLQELTKIADYRYRASFRETGRLTTAQQDEFAAHLREFLSVADGVLVSEALQMTRIENDVRVFDEAYFTYMMALVRKVLSEFDGKLLAVNVMNGHENAYTRGYTLSHDGTRTLRKMLTCALASKADIVNFFEWDEWNENTSFLPTLDNSFATRRIVRHFIGRERTLRPLQGDDLTKPNLIVSYRKALSPGEHFFVETLNVPDGTWKGRLGVTVRLRDENGRLVSEMGEGALSAERLEELRFSIPVSGEAAKARAFRVSVEWRHEDGRRGEVFDGLSPVSVARGDSWMVKAVKQPIRDLAPVSACDFARTPDGRLTVGLNCRETLKYVMLAEDGVVQYVHGEDGKERQFRESEDAAVFAVFATKWKSHRAKGMSLRVTGTDGAAEWLRGPFAEVIRGESCPLVSVSASAAPVYLRLPKAAVAAAKLAIDCGDLFKGEIPLDAAFGQGAYAIGGQDGVEFTVSRFARQAYFPPPLGTSACMFTVRPDKLRASSAYHLIAVTESGKTWRSAPVVDEKGPDARLPALSWDFSDKAGDVLVTTSGERRWFGMAGAEHSPANLFNRGATDVGAISCEERGPYLSTAKDAHPRRERQPDGETALVFDGVDDFAGFPHETLPQFGAYELRFEVFPLRDGKVETIGGAFGEGGGSLCWITRDEKGALTLDLMGLRFEHTTFRTGLPLPSGTWSTVRIVRRPDELVVEVNGQAKARPCCHPGRNTTVFALGGVAKRPFFKGKVKKLSVIYLD